MKIAICEDEKVQLGLIQDYCRKWMKDRRIRCNIKIFESAEAFLFDFEEEEDYDILFLDVEMGKMSGIDLAKKLRLLGAETKIVFITGNPEYVFEGYSVEAMDYIVKPLREEKLYQVLDKAYAKQDKKEKFLLVQGSGSIHRVDMKNICAIESIKHDVMLYLEGGSLLCKKSISQFEQEVDRELFYRCHRSYVVNLSKIVTISKKDVTLEGGYSIPIARGKWEGLNQAYLDFYRGVLCT